MSRMAAATSVISVPGRMSKLIAYLRSNTGLAESSTSTLEIELADREGLLGAGEADGQGLPLLVGPAVVGEELELQGDAAGERLIARAVEVGLDHVATLHGPAQDVLLRTIPLREVARHEAADGREVMRVVGALPRRLL